MGKEAFSPVASQLVSHVAFVYRTPSSFPYVCLLVEYCKYKIQ